VIPVRKLDVAVAVLVTAWEGLNYGLRRMFRGPVAAGALGVVAYLSWLAVILRWGVR
jgi:hypothetical protein